MMRSIAEHLAPARANGCRASAPGRANTWRAWLAALLVCMAAPLKAEEGPTFEFDIPAGALEAALVNYSAVSNVSVSWAPEAVRGLEQPGLKGAYTSARALQRLLADTGLDYRLTAENTATVGVASEAEAAPEAAPESLPRLSVAGEGVARETGALRDLRLKDEIFDQDISTDYLGKEDIDRFRGISTADVFQGLTNVYSGAARNGGALDANIRGIQGAGRAPVIIDGTEQAIVVSRGYRGADNRSYIDPSLIAGIQALKGPVSVREVNSQIGGAIAIRTLGASDILRPGERFGVELRLEAGNNATTPRLPTLRTGQDYRQIPGFLGQDGKEDNIFTPYRDPTLRVRPRTRGDNGPFAFGGDRAARIAAAGRKGDFDFFGAYAHRSRGNYFSGRNNADYYASDVPAAQQERGYFYTRRMALKYQPGNEVTNSSSEMRSWLFKSTWRIADDQALQLGYRHTRTATGEIRPSRLDTAGRDPRNPHAQAQTTYNPDFGYIQWPLSRVRIDALNLEYKYAPETRWLDAHANLWTTRANSNTYSRGGFPNVPRTRTDPTLINTALTNARNNRWGVTFSNKMALLPSVDLTVGGHYQYEKLRSDDPPRPRDHYAWISEGRAGNRQEYRANMQLEWRPTRFLTFNGGVGRAGYRAFDDGLNARLQRGETESYQVSLGYKRGYELEVTGREANEAINRVTSKTEIEALRRQIGPLDNLIANPPRGFPLSLLKLFRAQIQYRLDELIKGDYDSAGNEPRTVPDSAFSLKWLADANGKFRRAGIPPRCPRGVRRSAPIGAFSPADLEAAFRQIEARNKDNPENNFHRIAAVRKALSGASCEFSGPINKTLELKDPADNRVWRASGWEPYLSATLKLSDAIRLYGRYAERLRFASLFESTAGFGASPNFLRPLKPERIRAWEGAYIQDFSALFGFEGEGQRADFKLVYFHNTVRDVIDRPNEAGVGFINYDKQVIDGVELQLRLDTGRFFLNLGATRILTHKLCDASRAALIAFQSFVNNPPDCFKYGFGNSFLQARAIPTQTFNLTLGGRFFERRLELGARATWHSEYKNPQLEEFSAPGNTISGILATLPMTYGETLVLDAYARYNFNDQLTAELVSTNITDQYYADPLGRSLMPAPGRQIRLNFMYQF